MHQSIVIFLFSFLFFTSLFSCDNTATTHTEEETTNEVIDSTKENPIIEAPAKENKVDRGIFFSEEEQIRLRKLIDQSLINNLSDAIYSIEDAHTDQEMAEAFSQSTLTLDKIEEAIFKLNIDGNEMANKWAPFDSVMKVYAASCVAECTEFRFDYNIKYLHELAQKTTGSADESFFSLVSLAEGDVGGREGSWYNFFEQTWDYGGGSLLGDGSCYQFLDQSWAHLQTSNLFKSSIETIRKGCINDIGHPIYMLETKAILKEIDQILNKNILTTKEKEQVQKIKKAVLDGKTDDTAIQFGCKDPSKNCDWGG